MPSDDLRPATREDILFTLSYGLRFNTVGRPHRLASEVTAQVTAEMLLQHLERNGYVLMRKPGLPPPGPAAKNGTPGGAP
jgi:hypothetical protein